MFDHDSDPDRPGKGRHATSTGLLRARYARDVSESAPPVSVARRAVRVARILLFPAVVAVVFLGILPRIAKLETVWTVIG